MSEGRRSLIWKISSQLEILHRVNSSCFCCDGSCAVDVIVSGLSFAAQSRYWTPV